MRIPRLRLTVRGLMLAIFGFALGIVAVVAVNRYRVCMERASFYRSQAASYRNRSNFYRSRLGRLHSKTSYANQLETWLEEDREAARRCEDIRRQFEMSAWLLLPIPSEPKELRESVHDISG